MTRHYAVSVLAGDGIGHEVMPPALDVVDAAARRFGFDVAWSDHPWGCEYYRQHGAMMPPDAIETLAASDAILLGAVGDPAIPDHVSLWGMLIPIRRAFDLYVNLRPAVLLPGVPSPLRDPGEIDILVVRENSEGEYSEVGGRVMRGTPQEFALQEAIFTRNGTERIIEFAAKLAEQRSGRLVSATKSNGIIHSMTFWDEIFAEVMVKHPNVEGSLMHVDALAARFITHPAQLDVVVGSNLFGDILTDIGAVIVGSLGLAPSANINPDGRGPGMFEPVHGSAPDIAGKGIANPLAQIWSAALMLDHLGEHEAHDAIVTAIRAVLGAGETRTPDLGGTSRTHDVADAVLDAMENPS